MSAFDTEMTEYQKLWRRANVVPAEWGWQNKRQYEWILPRQSWEEGLWPGIRSSSNNSLLKYLQHHDVQRHSGVHNLKSSWMLCVNLYFPFGGSKNGRVLLADFLRDHVDLRIQAVDTVELEYAEPVGSGLHPSELLGESGGSRGAGQTSPDIAFLVNGHHGLVLTENKFIEHSFYRCSALRIDGSDERPGNPNPARCKDALAVVNDVDGQCHQAEWGRKYWKHLAPVIRREHLSGACPAASAGYQLFRQQALAEGIAASDKYEFVISCLAVDKRNDALRDCLKSVGIGDIREWGKMFDGKARFAVFTHQDWVAWVRARGDRERWANWLTFVEARYGFTQ